MTPVEVSQGSGPIVLGLPHTGTYVPPDVARRLNDNGRLLTDTDWHIDRLYDRLIPDLTTVRATFHRYVIDANRDPGGASLYPGQNTTGLVPLTDFDGAPIWAQPPTQAEMLRRRADFHAPYHAAMQSQLDRVRRLHGVVVLYDCHSIRSRIPFLFDGRLPDFNIGTNLGASCAAALEKITEATCRAVPGYHSVANGRFKGGWTTRHYGKPDKGQHAIQMELAQSSYLTSEAPPWSYDSSKAEDLRAILARLLSDIARLAPTLGEPA